VEKKPGLLKPISAWYMAGGIVTMMAALIACLIEFQLGALLAIPAFILFVLLGWSEFSTGRTIQCSRVGSRRSIMRTSVVTLVARILLISLLWGDVIDAGAGGRTPLLPWDDLSIGALLFYLSIIWLSGEAIISLYLARHRDLFLRPESEEARPDLSHYALKDASACPHCQGAIESLWRSCPHCGGETPRSLSMEKAVNMFERKAQEKALPETRAGHYARLAEALLKNGQPDEAVAAYRQAIVLTGFPVKRTNYMVQAARVLRSGGHDHEAVTLLDEALAIDPSDLAGASKLKIEIGDLPPA
jgi:tetratricopeptide (TPR) repeat protein